MRKTVGAKKNSPYKTKENLISHQSFKNPIPHLKIPPETRLESLYIKLKNSKDPIFIRALKAKIIYLLSFRKQSNKKIKLMTSYLTRQVRSKLLSKEKLQSTNSKIQR